MPDVRLIPECHADTTLIRFLTRNDPRVIHASGFSGVGSTMRDAPADSLLIGFVDYDKRIPPYFDNFETIGILHRVILRKSHEGNRYLVILQKAIESFLMWNAMQVGVDVKDFGFSDDIKMLGNKLKSLQIENDENFQGLLNSLDSKNAPGFVRIKAIIAELIH